MGISTVIQLKSREHPQRILQPLHYERGHLELKLREFFWYSFLLTSSSPALLSPLRLRSSDRDRKLRENSETEGKFSHIAKKRDVKGKNKTSQMYFRWYVDKDKVQCSTTTRNHQLWKPFEAINAPQKKASTKRSTKSNSARIQIYEAKCSTKAPHEDQSESTTSTATELEILQEALPRLKASGHTVVSKTNHPIINDDDGRNK